MCTAVTFTTNKTKMAAEEKDFRQLEDLGCPAEIQAMKWSPKMDLIAIITDDGDVWLNRLSWQRVWTLRSSEHKATSLAWRPDGKVLALGLNICKIHLVNVENGECLHEYEVASKPECLEWVATKRPVSTNLPENVRIFTEKADEFLAQLPSLPSGSSTVFSEEKSSNAPWDPKRLKDLEGTLSFLVVAEHRGVITLLTHGMLPVGEVNVCSLYEEGWSCRILSAYMEANIQFLSVVLESSSTPNFSDAVVTMATFDTTLYCSRSHELEVLSLKYGYISSLLTYFQGTFQAMSEAWEDILLEIDSRLEKYAESLGPDTSVPEEFLALFTCGTASPELEAFLANDLTEKGLKKLGKTVESSYSNIQTLALKNLQSASNAMLYHLNDLLGMAKWYERFGVLGLSETLVTECLKVLGSLMMKTQELFSVIDSALRGFTAFFKWLYLVILQFLGDDIPTFIKRFNQEDVSLITEFLHCQLANGSKGKMRFSMERVGQYLEKEPLTFQIDHSESIWTKFLESCPEIEDAPFIFSVCPEKSLATLHDELVCNIHATFKKLTQANEQALSCNLRIPLFPSTEGKKHVVTQHSVGGGSHHWVAIPSSESVSESVYVLRVHADATTSRALVADGLSVHFPNVGNTVENYMHVIYLALYDETTLTMLLRCGEDDENSEDSLAQFQLSSLPFSRFQLLTSKGASCAALDWTRVDGSQGIVKRRNLARMKSHHVAVSGLRKVSCVLSASRTRVKLFDMDASEEDAEETLDELQTSAVSTDSGV